MRSRLVGLLVAVAVAVAAAWPAHAGADVLQEARELRRQLQYDAAAQRLAMALPDLQGETRAQALILLAAVNTDPKESRRQLLDATKTATSVETRQSAALELARLDFGRGNYKSAQARLAEQAGEPQSALWLGLTTVALGGGPDLRQILEPARHTDLGQLLTAWADLHEGDARRAVANLEPLTTRRHGDYSATALLWKAQAEVALGDGAAALQSSTSLHERYPDSPEAAQVEAVVVAVRTDAGGGGSAPSHEPRLALQVGAFEDRANALRYRERLAPDLPSVRIDQIQGSRGPLYRVLVGSFTTRDDAVAFGDQQLKPLGVPWSIVLPAEDARP